jgi:hypothetical protein
MCASVSPHDATSKEEPILSKVLDAAWSVVAFPFITNGELKWATGILSLDDDFESCAITSFISYETLAISL